MLVSLSFGVAVHGGSKQRQKRVRMQATRGII